jgi:uncharacterized membrane protein YgdD (TMEM256/DUF423 family)
MFEKKRYARVIYKDHSMFGGIPPIGGSCLILGWILMALKKAPKI